MLGEGPDGHVPPVPPTRRVSELERPQPSPGWGRFFWHSRRGIRTAIFSDEPRKFRRCGTLSARAEKIIGEHCRAVAAPVRYFRMGCQYRPPAASGTYSENGPVGADINPRRVRLIARRRQGLDASHAVRAQSPADRAGIHRGSFWRHSFNGCRQDEDRGRMPIPDAKTPLRFLTT
jgi:hypothetical protein